MKFSIILAASVSLLFLSCSKRLGKIEALTFEVSTEKNTYKVGEAVVFNLKNNADIISFYSGIPGNNYLYKDSGRVIPVNDAGVTLEFSTQLAGTGTQPNQLSVWISNDFNGKLDYTSVKAATWTDITSLFRLATTTTLLAAGTKEISTYFASGRPVYIGFKYITKPQQANQAGRIWYIQSLLVKSMVPPVDNNPVLITDHQRSGFQIVNQFPADAPSLSNVISTRITMAANAFKIPGDSLYVPGSQWNDPGTETWAVSKALTKAPVSLPKDYAVGVKGINTDIVTSYSHTYTTPGTYKAYFIGQNSNLEGDMTITREIELTIQP